MSALPALALAIALTYVIGGLFRPHMPRGLSLIIDIALCIVIYKITHHYLKRLKE